MSIVFAIKEYLVLRYSFFGMVGYPQEGRCAKKNNKQAKLKYLARVCRYHTNLRKIFDFPLHWPIICELLDPLYNLFNFRFVDVRIFSGLFHAVDRVE